MNRSKYWVNNMRQPLSVPRREETVMLATWHGTPLKRLVFDMDDVHSATPQYKDIVFRQTRAWDYLLSDNPFSTEKFQSCFLFEKAKILEYGYPANDPMYASDREEQAQKIKKKMGIPENKKVILYAPTWRDDNFYEAGQYGFDLDLDVNRLKEEFGDEYVLLLRLHYFVVDQLDLSKYGDFTVDGSSYDDITDLYLISDILIEKENDKYQLDLWECNRIIFRECGVLDENIHLPDVCTCCNSDVLFSHKIGRASCRERV